MWKEKKRMKIRKSKTLCGGVPRGIKLVSRDCFTAVEKLMPRRLETIKGRKMSVTCSFLKKIITNDKTKLCYIIKTG